MGSPRLFLVSALVAFLFGLFPGVSRAADTKANPVFGPYEAIAFDSSYLQGVRYVPATNDVFIKFQPGKEGSQLIVRISMAYGAEYRNWFTGGQELVAQQNTGRPANTWSDRVQTTANYIEYWVGQHLILHLKKIKS